MPRFISLRMVSRSQIHSLVHKRWDRLRDPLVGPTIMWAIIIRLMVSVCVSVTNLEQNWLGRFASNLARMCKIIVSREVLLIFLISVLVAEKMAESRHFGHFLAFKNYLLLQFQSDRASFCT